MCLREQAEAALAGIKGLLEHQTISRDKFHREYVASLPAGSRLGDNQFSKVLKKGHLAGQQEETLRSLVSAWREWRRDQCPPCRLAKQARAIFAPDAVREIVPARYLGEYTSYNCGNMGRQVSRHAAFFEPCSDCENIRFRVVRRDGSYSVGGVYFNNQFIHILLVEGNYMPKVVLYGVPDVDVAPLHGLALWSQSPERPDPSASRVLFVKSGSKLSARADLETYVSDKLLNQGDEPGYIPIFGRNPIISGH